MADMMERQGGSFVKALGECFFKADRENWSRLEKAFPEYVKEYKDRAREHNEAVDREKNK